MSCGYQPYGYQPSYGSPNYMQRGYAPQPPQMPQVTPQMQAQPQPQILYEIPLQDVRFVTSEEAKAFIETGIDAYVFISNRFAKQDESDEVLFWGDIPPWKHTKNGYQRQGG